MSHGSLNVPGSSFPVITPLVGFIPRIAQQIERFPFDKNVFLMMRFRRTNKKLSDFIIETLRDAGLNGIRADDDDWNLTNNVYNPIAVLYCCRYGIALFDEAEEGQTYNTNVIYELGMMQCLDRTCLILRNAALPKVPFDLIKDLYMPYGGDLAVRTNVQKWLRQIGVGPASVHPHARNNTEGSGLQIAAVEAPKTHTNTVVATPDNVETTDFGWKIASKTEKAWHVSWRMRLTNKSQRAVGLKIRVLFLDENGFALEDDINAHDLALSPHTEQIHKQTITMSPELGERIRSSMATVTMSKQRGGRRF